MRLYNWLNVRIKKLLAKGIFTAKSKK